MVKLLSQDTFLDAREKNDGYSAAKRSKVVMFLFNGETGRRDYSCTHLSCNAFINESRITNGQNKDD